MNDWAFLLVPFLVLPIVLLFRFVGCGSFGAADAPEVSPGPVHPRYRDYIMAAANNPGPVKNPTAVA